MEGIEGAQELRKAVDKLPKDLINKKSEKPSVENEILPPKSTSPKLEMPQTPEEAASQVVELSSGVEKLREQGFAPKKEGVDKEKPKNKYIVDEEMIESLTKVYDIPRKELKQRLDEIAEKTKKYESLSKLSQISLKMKTAAGEKLAKMLPATGEKLAKMLSATLEKLDTSSMKFKLAVVATMVTTGLEIGIPGPFIKNMIQLIVNALGSL